MLDIYLNLPNLSSNADGAV